jgi:propionyl-CoA carboxylase alpha chain
MPAKKVVDTSSMIISPMPGIVKSVTVKVGDMVSEGAEICTVEAMKMQNKLVASKQGKVTHYFCESLKIILQIYFYYISSKIKKVNTKVGESVEEGKVLVELE